MQKKLKAIDLTHTLSSQIPSWDGSCGFELSVITDYKDCTPPNLFRIQKMQCNNGIGTHIDAPAHIIKNGRTIDKLNLKENSFYIGTCRNTNIAQWHKGEFVFIGFNFGIPYIETIKYYGDIKNTSFDGFIPIEEINFSVDNIIKEKNLQDYKNGARKIYQNLNINNLNYSLYIHFQKYYLYLIEIKYLIKLYLYYTQTKIIR